MPWLSRAEAFWRRAASVAALFVSAGTGGSGNSAAGGGAAGRAVTLLGVAVAFSAVDACSAAS